MIDNLLNRLEKVKKTGTGKWIARCCAHDDGRPSLAIKEVDDGRILIHCFAGCGVDEILGAIGLDFDALFPPRSEIDAQYLPKVRRGFSANDMLELLAFESLVLLQLSKEMYNNGELSESESMRLFETTEKLQSAHSLINESAR